MTALANLLRPADRERLEDRLGELREIDREMRRPGSLAAACEPPSLHGMGEAAAKTSGPSPGRPG